VTVVAVLCGACGDGARSGDAAGSGAPSSSAVPSGEVDISALDTGSYQRVPSDPFPPVTGDDIVPVEGQRMAEFVVAPFEVDRDLTDTVLPTEIIRSRGNIAGVVGDGPANVPANQRFLAGFVAAATTPTQRVTDPKRVLIQMVIRYMSAQDATAAARQMSAATLGTAGASRVDLDGAPDTTAVRTPGVTPRGAAPTTALATFTGHGDYLLYTYSAVPQTQQAGQIATVRKALSLQEPLIDRFPKTPTRSQNGGRMPSAQVDANRILLYALPNPKADAVNGTDRAVYGPRGMSLLRGSPESTFTALNAAGSPHNAYWLTSVYRASTGAAADTLRSTFVTDALTAGGWQKVASPRGLPIATCLTRDATSGSQNECYVVVGRYVAQSDDASAQAAAQQISAQYLILTQADQNAN
jgi:hypothetical protein